MKDYETADLVCYLPFDFKANVKRFIELINPAAVILIKYEFWPNLIRCLSREQVPVFLLAARFRSQQLFFRWYGRFYLDLLRLFKLIMVQDESSKELLLSHGISDVVVTGDSRVDRVLSISHSSEEIAGLTEFVKNSFIIIGGSTWPPEESILQRVYRERQELLSGRRIKIIIAPHDISEGHLRKIEKAFGSECIRYSKLTGSDKSDKVNEDVLKKETGGFKAQGPGGKASGPGVLIIDQIGLLSKLYKYGDLAFIGGGLGRGLHNTLEPAAFGLPIIFGMRYKKFSEAVSLVKKNAAFPIKNYDNFKAILATLLRNENTLINAGAGSMRYVKGHEGATALSISYLMENI